ncbi:hypothetical protein DAPPUDRAFT_249835 [Daphnia pulex]|uniref:Uncharacterized protein n=1 Tax=Daphnia pulex TaxID=6669 RepID=E9GXD4_DAPPU|nr:hypothetical protein DAPPUDRAFT_249835 [Daphnia pulex]|eukprot:EFX75877.1 hypothetical protein DAPPUDRAFT_249835 [Daphnia pulex]
MEPSTAVVPFHGKYCNVSMERARRVLFSAVQLNSILPIETDEGRGRGNFCNPKLAEPTMFPDHNGPRRGSYVTITLVARPSHIFSGRESSTGLRRFNPSDRLVGRTYRSVNVARSALSSTLHKLLRNLV